jgi:MFS family permease
MEQLHWHDYITINIYWLGLTTISQSNGLIVPLLVQRFVGVERQATAFGRLRLYTLMTALLIQALAGMLSDRSTLRWGRRRPFILIGTLLNIICLIGIGASPSYWFLFGIAMLSQIASNIAHGAEQGLIPDLVPEDRRGRFSGVKSMMELLPVIVVALIIGPLVGAGQMWAGIFVASGVLFLSMALTMLVRETPQGEPPEPLDWRPFGRLVAMTATFLIVILGFGGAIRGLSALLSGIDSISLLAVAMGIGGTLAMAAAIVIGVWTSVRICIGPGEASQATSFSWWVVNRLAFLVGATNLAGFAIYFLQGRLGLAGNAAAGPAAKMMLLIGMLVLLGALPSGWLADRIGRKKLVTSSGIIAAIGTIVLVLAPNLGTIYVGGSIVGAASGVFFTTNWALGIDLVPKETAGRYLGISNLAGAGAGAVGSYIGGPIADFFTTNVPQIPGLGYVILLAIYGMLFLLSSLVMLKIHAR